MGGGLGGKTAIVTGAGRGLGRSISDRLAREGAEVALVGRTREQLEATANTIRASGGSAWTVKADVTVIGDVQDLVDAALARWGHIDILVNNAGVVEAATPFVQLSEDQWDLVIDTNLKGYFLVGQRVARAMVAHGRGAIVNIASIDSLGANGRYAAYNSSKAGILGLNRTMAVELAPHNIRVNALSPGFVATDMVEILGAAAMRRLRDDFHRVPMRRMVEADEVASACLFLLSDDASAVTGQNLVVDCGLTANLYVMETLT